MTDNFSSRTYHWEVEKTGLTLVKYLKSQLEEDYSHRFLKHCIDLGLCCVNRHVARISTRSLKTGDQVTLTIPSVNAIEKKSTAILYEDEEIVVINKSAGICSDVGSLQKILSSNSCIHLPHRLDKQTSGILILAKNKKALAAMEMIFRKRQIHKTYAAIVRGVPKEAKGAIKSSLSYSRYQENRIEVQESSTGKYAETYWEKGVSGSNVCVVWCYPKTGRTHQIRVHLASIGHPIVGDYQYGKDQFLDLIPTRMLLHALKVVFIHPFLKHEMVIEAPFPEEMQKIMDAIEKRRI